MALEPNSFRVALVTGANRGIGLEIARQLAQLGYTALIGSRDEMRGEHAAQALRSEGLDCQFVSLDVTNQASIGSAARLIEEKFGKLDALVNNAAIASPPNGVPSGTASPTTRRSRRSTRSR